MRYMNSHFTYLLTYYVAEITTKSVLTELSSSPARMMLNASLRSRGRSMFGLTQRDNNIFNYCYITKYQWHKIGKTTEMDHCPIVIKLRDRRRSYGKGIYFWGLNCAKMKGRD